jgi:hypothetical protein
LAGSTVAKAHGLDALAGTWNSDETGDNIRITKNQQFGVFDAHFSWFGQTRIITSSQYGSNIAFDLPNGERCHYYITFTNNFQRLNMQPRGPKSSFCPRSIFNRAS